MSPDEILADLHDIYLPQESGEWLQRWMSPWPLGVFLTASIAIVAWVWYRRTVWRREIAREIDRIQSLAADPTERPRAWADLAHLLRRIALLCRGHANIAHTTDEQWLGVLRELFDDERFVPLGRLLLTHPYRRRADDIDTLNALLDLVRAKLHRLRRAR